jgi:ketosteroid isomerase-like protein
MSGENVEAFKRGIVAANRRDLDALLEGLDPEVEWHPAINMALGGETTVYRGHEGIRQLFREADEVFGETQYEFSEIRDLGDRLLARGRARMRGKESGAETESPISFLVDFSNGKATRVRSFLDPKEALEAAGLRE